MRGLRAVVRVGLGLCAAVLALGLQAVRGEDAPSGQSPNLKHYYPVPPVAQPTTIETDLCVYGGTSGGVTAAIQATRMGKKAVLVEFGTHVGGLTTGGLSATDGGSAAAGMAREFYSRVGALSGFRPAKAEQVMLDMLKEAGVPVYFEHRLVEVSKDGNRITAIRCENGVTFKAKMFVDATYEGDLFAAAGCSFHLGREANSVYNETISGVQPGRKTHQFVKDIDPYVVPGDEKSGLLWGIAPTGPGEPGAGDNLIQAYNFRMQLEKGGVPVPKPNNYDPKRYELLLRYIQAGGGTGYNPHPGDNNNNGGFSTDHIGFNYEWPDGPERGDPKAVRNEAYFKRLYETRERIYQDHITYQMGFVWFLTNDPRVPEELRKKYAEWGMARHSFAATGHWPHQLYIREGRRLVSDFVMTEHHCRGKEVVPDSVGLAQYTMDSHNTQRYAIKDPKSGKMVVRNEGDVQVGIPGPYPVAYRAIVPKEAEAANLLVPVCLSSSHMAYGSIRMEPVFMVLGQSAATAACMAIDDGTAVQQVPYAKLREKLLADKQMLEWTGPRRTVTGGGAAVDPKKLAGIAADDEQAEKTGDWSHGNNGGFVGTGYLHDANDEKGKRAATFKLPVKDAGKYEVRIAYISHSNRATNVPVTISGQAGSPVTVKVNQKQPAAVDKIWQPLGTFEFAAGSTAEIKISNADTNGYVIADAVQLLPAK
jgi:hypothetical protein